MEKRINGLRASSPPMRAPKETDYQRLVSELSVLLEEARRAAVRTVNTILTTTYWEIARRKPSMGRNLSLGSQQI
jgi:hypothetical protein